MRKLSPATCQLILRIFSSQDQAEVAHVLANECADNLTFLENQDENGLEPVRFAILKLSRGNIAEFRWWANLARVDWRDLLTAAGFGGSPTAHEEWAKMRYGVTSTKPSGT
jgi:hypothetical protein